jgi:hypothetical protein
MPFFGLSDIKFDKGPPSRKGPLGALVGSQFEQTTLRYPLDIGNFDKGHYIVFYIREQKNTSFARGEVTGGDANLGSSGGVSVKNLSGVQNLTPNFGGEILNKINSGLGSINNITGGALGSVTSAISSAAGNVVGGINNIFGQQSIQFGGSSAQTKAVIDNSIKKISGGSLGFLRTTRLTKDAIALYMPETLQYTYSQSYDQLNLGGEIGGQALAAGQAASEAFKSGGGMEAAASIGKSALETFKQKIGTGAAKLLGSDATGQAVLAATGRVQNPMLEMVYKSPNFRTFQFDFLLYPRDEREALEVQRILERFRFHQAPEILKGTGGFLVPPSEFDIKFYYAGAENPNIPPIATCVLTTFDINYAPNGFSAYEIPNENNPALGRTGMPVAIQITLQFQEVTYLTKEDFRDDLAQADTLGKVQSNLTGPF